MEVIEIPKGQKARVLWYIQNYKSITPHEALKEFGIMRLAAVIFELRKEYDIETVMEKAKNRFGEDVQYARYLYYGVKEAANG